MTTVNLNDIKGHFAIIDLIDVIYLLTLKSMNVYILYVPSNISAIDFMCLQLFRQKIITQSNTLILDDINIINYIFEQNTDRLFPRLNVFLNFANTIESNRIKNSPGHILRPLIYYYRWSRKKC